PALPVVADDAADVNALGAQRSQHEIVAADPPDEADLRAEPRRRDRLVRALPPGMALKRGPGQRLAGPWQPLGPRDEVDVGRADDGDPRLHACLTDHARAISAASRQLPRTISRFTSTLRRPVC